MNASDSIVIIPTYNEKENIEKIIRAVFGLEKQFHILVIDDGSPDGTAQIVKGLMDGEFGDRLFLMERSGKLGLGTAYIAGFKWALEREYEYIFEMDADFSHDPNDLPRLYSACADEGYDLSIGSRYISGVNVVNWPMGRVLMSYFASMYVRFVTGHHGRIQVLQAPSAADHRTGQDSFQGLCLPDRDEVHGLQDWLQNQGGARHLREPPRGNQQDERRHLQRGVLRRDAPSLGRMVPKVSDPSLTPPRGRT